MCEHSTKFCIINCACCAGQCRAYLRHMHSVPHCTPCTYCTHGIHCCHTITRHLVLLTIFCALLYGSRSTQMLHISQKPTANSTKLHTTSSVYKAALCLSQQLFNTLACQEAALHFNHALPILFVLYSIQFLHIIVLCTS